MTEPKQRRKPRKYTDEFKQQLVELYCSGKRRCDICREYDIATVDLYLKLTRGGGQNPGPDNSINIRRLSCIHSKRSIVGTPT